MRFGRIIRRRFQSLLRRSRAEAELRQEIELHFEQLTKEYMEGGLSERDARVAARRAFGPVELAKDRCRDARRVQLVDDLAKDVAYAFRLLKKSPAFTLTVVLSLALGIGANTIVFSVLNALVLKPLPIEAPERVYFVNRSTGPSNSFPNYRDIRDRNKVFESLFAYRITEAALDGSSGAHRVWGYLVTGNYFESLGIQPALGRFFTAAEDRIPNASPFVVLSYACWQNRFGGNPSMVGRDIHINRQAYTVLGVAPRGFHGTEVFYWAEIWIPMMMQPQIESNPWLDNRNTFNVWIAGRLKAGVSARQAEANLKTIAGELAREHPVNEGMRLTLSRPGMAGATGREPTRAFVGGIMLLACVVLFAACANLAALLAARGADRERDLAIRVSIGAGRGRMVRQSLTESLVIFATGGAAGCALAAALLNALSHWRPPLEFPVQFDVNPDWRVFLFACSAAVLTGLVFGAGPALGASRAQPALSLKGLATPSTGRRRPAGDVLLAVQIALCSVLVTSSLVAVRGLIRSFETPLGFTPDGAAVIGYDLGLARYDETRGVQFEQRALAEVSRLPGVESAAYSSSVPLSIDQSTRTVYSESTTDFRPKNAFDPVYYYVSPNYFHAAGARLMAGRSFTWQDNDKSPRVAIVNQTFARRVIGTAEAVGRRFRFGSGNDAFVGVIGVVEDGKYETLTESPRAAVFFPILQRYSPTVVLMARSRRSEGELATEMERAVQRLDPRLAIYGAGSLRQMLGLVYLPMRAAVMTLGAFGVLALMLAITGIYGLSAYTVSRRSKEIGIRVAIGAQPRQVLRFVFGRTGALTAAGAIAGLCAAVLASGVLASIVHQVNPRDPLVVAAAVLTVALAALVAALGPARRAISIDPVKSLRHE